MGGGPFFVGMLQCFKPKRKGTGMCKEVMDKEV